MMIRVLPAIVQNWGNELIKQLQNNLLKNKTNASSGLSQSIDPKITQHTRRI
jgi:hypothetical protein